MIKTDNELYEIKLGVSSHQADLAIVSSDSTGTPGYLNKLALKVYGYDQDILKTINLDTGYNVIHSKGLRPILVIVTIDQTLGAPNTALTFRKNLDNGIRGNLELLANKKIWFPLLGTGTGGLNFDESLEITINTINGFLNEFKKRNIKFIISIPNNDRGKEFFNEINDIPDTPEIKKEIKKKKSIPIDPESKTLENDTTIKKSFDSDSVSSITDLLKGFSGKFYMISTALGRHSEVVEFYNDLSEEHSSYKKYKAIIESIKPGDIVITNDILEENKGNTMYSVNKLGIIKKSPKNEDVLSIDWKLQDQKMEFTTSINYSSSLISRPDNDDVLKIVSQINPEQLDLLFTEVNEQNTITTITKITSIAGITSDADSGEDLLDISRDVAAFARVIATKSFTPPLAIALFGTWGSGKSFFMRKLKERIQKLSNKSPESGFCSGVAHVHFNAWSYMDTNLWAGIITKIFEGLNQYISNEENAAVDHKKEIEEAIAKELSITQNEITKLETEIKGKDAQLENLEENKENQQTRLDNKIKQIREASLHGLLEKIDTEFQVQQKIEEAIDTNVSIIKKTAELKEIIPKKYWENPEELYQQSTSAITFLKTFFLKKYLWINILCIIAILLLALGLPKVITYITTLIGVTDYGFITPFLSILTIISGLYARGIKVYKGLQPLVASFWNLRETYIEKKEQVIFSFQQDEKALALEIEQIKDEISDINHQIYQTQEQKAALVFRKNNTLSTEALKSFIEKRSVSVDYKKHLGLVSIIRNDFEVLSTLFSEHIDEVENSKKENIEKFRKHFERPLERIVLYIDDLDRCPEDRVVEVLEAVNLLMAYPLFVVIVGVDPRWVKNALIKKHRLHFTKDDDDSQKQLIDASSYLEKIFQVPFNLKAAEDTSVKNMIKTLLQSKTSNTTSAAESTKANVPADKKATTKPIKESDTAVEETTIDSGSKETIAKPPVKKSEIIETSESFEPIEFSEKEIELLQEMSIIIGPSPRAIKRFINIYRIVKAHENFGYTNDKDKQEMLAVMFLLALPIGKYKELAITFFAYVTHTNQSQTTIISYFNNTTINKPDEINTNLQTDVREKIIESNIKDILNIKRDVFHKHLPFIKRFAFTGF
ncbi:P-loop NTPase fold protein [uncultured Aquimarina sp.]|uniref:P-loop NTPase fold protein n=1 Tax=uncultured Aquimarina sp. TaxID=575652 RepID=UPI002617345F|nr:P-loop NTPase fold protein [uncultured Aquimarina sp.]